MTEHLVHWDDVRPRERRHQHISARWFNLGGAARSRDVGVQRIMVDPGRRSTPVHVHFWVLAGSGLLWQDGATASVGPGDTIVHLPGRGTHTLVAGESGLDVLAFGTRVPLELCYLPRAQHSWAGPVVVPSPGFYDLFPLDDRAEPLEIPEPGERPRNVVALSDVATDEREGRLRADLGRAAGSRRTGLKHVKVAPGALSAPPHCHSADEELLVVLDGEGVLLLGDERLPVRAGHVLARPPGTGVAHSFRGGPGGMTLLAYGTREPNDICYYPRTNKVILRGVGVVGRIEQLDLWEGEPLR
jgi:uncharacterized cupin superfamily protein